MAIGKELRRYTDVLSVIDLIAHKRLTLTTPSGWVDQNDSHGLDVYKRRRGADSVIAFCMTEAPETYHHWHIFAGHKHGACVIFKKTKLVSHLNGVADIVHGPVVYRNLSSINREKEIPTEELPFLKRKMFVDEKEYRIVGVEDEFFDINSRQIPITLDIVDRVIFSPYAPRPLLDTLKEMLVDLDGAEHIAFRHSTLTNNLEWRRAIDFSAP